MHQSATTEETISDPELLALAARVAYEIDPDDAYPANYSGHVRVTMKDGSIHETRQPHLRGGAREPLERSELIEKFRANVIFGGLSREDADRIEAALSGLFDSPDMRPLAALRL